MKNLFFLLIISVLEFVFSCKSGPSASQIAEQDKLYQEVMDIHDAVMPRMSELERTAESLRRFIPSDKLDETMKEQIFTTVQAIDSASNGMMTWMNEFRQPGLLRESMQHDAILAYLQAEKGKMETVQNNMLSSLDAGLKILASLQSAETPK
jgi:hypothetical protein